MVWRIFSSGPLIPIKDLLNAAVGWPDSVGQRKIHLTNSLDGNAIDLHLGCDGKGDLNIIKLR